MSAILSYASNTSILSYLGSVGSSIQSNPIPTFANFFIYMIAEHCAGALSALTGGYFQLNRLISQPTRKALRMMGSLVGNISSSLQRGISRGLGISSTKAIPIRIIVVTPVVEELIYRLPLIMTSLKIDAMPFEFISTPILKGVVNLTGGQVLKIALSIIISIGFTYGHHENPSPEQAAGLFVASLVHSYLALQHLGGLGNAIITHAFHNLLVVVRTVMHANPASSTKAVKCFVRQELKRESRMLLPWKDFKEKVSFKGISEPFHSSL